MSIHCSSACDISMYMYVYKVIDKIYRLGSLVHYRTYCFLHPYYRELITVSMGTGVGSGYISELLRDMVSMKPTDGTKCY